MKNNIVAIVVTYNRKILLRECIECLLIQSCACDILIIDNASDDGTQEYISDYIDYKSINYLNTGANLGGAGGFQFGIRKAIQMKYEYVWIMDDDSMPTETALEELVNAGNKLHKYGFLGSKVLWKDLSICNMNRQKDKKMKHIKDYSIDMIEAGTSTFVSLFIPSKVVLNVGLPIKEFFIWCDDQEYTRRISLKYPCYVVTKSCVIHKCNTNNGPNISTDTEERIDRYKYAFRNDVYLYRREGIKGWIHLFMRTPYHIFRVMFKAKTLKKERIKIILKSTFIGLKFNPPIEYVNEEII